MKKQFNHVKVPALRRIGVLNTPDGRFYISPNGVYLPSVTTILGWHNRGFIESWMNRIGIDKATRIRDQAATRGMIIHTLAEMYLKGEPIDYLHMDPFIKMLFLPIREEINRVDNVRHIESTVYSENLRTAGTTDLIADFDGVPSIVDFKTSLRLKDADKIENYFEQETAYSLMYEELTGERIDQIVTIIVNESQYDNSTQVFINKREDFIDSLKRKIAVYHDNNKEIIPNGTG
jgi:hypothetical protein